MVGNGLPPPSGPLEGDSFTQTSPRRGIISIKAYQRPNQDTSISTTKRQGVVHGQSYKVKNRNLLPKRWFLDQYPFAVLLDAGQPESFPASISSPFPEHYTMWQPEKNSEYELLQTHPRVPIIDNLQSKQLDGLTLDRIRYFLQQSFLFTINLHFKRLALFANPNHRTKIHIFCFLIAHDRGKVRPLFYIVGVKQSPLGGLADSIRSGRQRQLEPW